MEALTPKWTGPDHRPPPEGSALWCFAAAVAGLVLIGVAVFGALHW